MTDHERHKRLSDAGRRGGLKGGPARRDRLSAEERKAIARLAATARWHKDVSGVIREMLDKIAADGRPRALYVRGREVKYFEIGRAGNGWNEDYCVGFYDGAATFTSVTEDVMAM